MKLSRKHLRKIIIEAGVIPSDLIEYFITTEEYEKCAKIKNLMNFRKMIDNILNSKDVK